MLSHQKAVRFVIVLFFLICSSGFLFADDSKSPTAVNVTAMPLRIVQCLRAEIEASGFLMLSEQPRFQLFITVRAIPERDEIVLSLVTTMPLPDKVVELVAVNEGFYKTV